MDKGYLLSSKDVLDFEYESRLKVFFNIPCLDEKLDKASLRGLNQVTIIHGIGTGALKNAIREYLQESPYISKFRYGDDNGKNEGMVIADLLW